ncbi:MAG: hypothetical protein AB1457_14365 [Chloroflexota bacterium]|nr:MAG: hypothetical protein KatS3mg045_1265 [Bellilinea sp.]
MNERPPDWSIVSLQQIDDDDYRYDRNLLEEMAAILTEIMYILDSIGQDGSENND